MLLFVQKQHRNRKICSEKIDNRKMQKSVEPRKQLKFFSASNFAKKKKKEKFLSILVDIHTLS